ncbi:putative membrane protein [Stackebrandtia endophytica]|uniref:Putative membrane protein n=2 Tax=Stackebrandtia endophytica TaxID=1496996 RepID=A0A543AZ02_9ACTN|nr:putative membrane protein [Stackebrandtia endophytica]
MDLAEGLKIDWANMPTYNTIMAVAAGAGLLLVVALMRRVLSGAGELEPSGYALAFGVLGTILTLTGLHMTLTWPLAPGGFPFDNIIFGEPALAFGVLMLAAALFLWRRGEALAAGPDREVVLARVAGPVSVFVVGMGLGCFGIAVAGVKYQLFAAPPEEPISGAFADYPLIEAIFISGLYALVGLGAVLGPWALRNRSRGLFTITGIVWGLAGIAFLLFGALNFFTHIGLIVNTM